METNRAYQTMDRLWLVLEKAGGSKVRTIELIRHGATALNSRDTSVDRIRGHIDVPLSAEGKQEAEDCAKKIAKRPPDILYTSDLKRAADTARIIASHNNIPLEKPTVGLRPWDVGCFSGQSTKDALPELARYAHDTPDKKVPGGDKTDGESFNTFRKRFFKELVSILEAHPNKRVGIVSHYRNGKLLQAWAANGYPPDGSIDQKVFQEKGEATGHAERVKLPLARLRAVARWSK